MAKRKSYVWTPEMHCFCDERRSMLRRELTDAFNARFDTARSYEAVRNFCKRNGYHTGRTGCFEKGNKPFNKGMKGWTAAGTEATRFKVGHVPTTHVPVGTYSMTTARRKFVKRTGKYYDIKPYWRLKVAENKWHFLHQLVYQATHGSIPKGSVVIFVDGDTLNCSSENLVCVSRAALAVLNSRSGFADAPLEVRRTIIANVKLRQKINAARFDVVTGPKGERKSLKELADDYGIAYPTVIARINTCGYSVVEALAKPLHAKRAGRRESVTG